MFRSKHFPCDYRDDLYVSPNQYMDQKLEFLTRPFISNGKFHKYSYLIKPSLNLYISTVARKYKSLDYLLQIKKLIPTY